MKSLGICPTLAIYFFVLIAHCPSALFGFSTPNFEQSMSQGNAPVWDPVAQIYVGGNVPENAAVQEMLQNSRGCLRVFGYGSLCWNPGTGVLGHPSVKSRLSRAKGYRRCWAQKSTDHRGFPSFPGIVCTLLKDEEVRLSRELKYEEATLTEGLVYEVPSEMVDECLAELDFREKGGYARDIIEVVDDESGETQQALLYRGTIDNPAFWPRVLVDLPFAAAIMSVSVGPSGENRVYLHQLEEFLRSSTGSSDLEQQFDDTISLSDMTLSFEREASLTFFVGSGSNQHNQLLLNGAEEATTHGEDTHQMTESVVCRLKSAEIDQVTNIFAGSGHSALLTQSGSLFLWGWNEYGQLGTRGDGLDKDSGLPISPVRCLDQVLVDTVSLGFSHTLVTERGTGRLFVFGDNHRGQVSGHRESGKDHCVYDPMTPSFLEDVVVKDVAAGVFHSAAVTRDGKLVTFGDSKFGQCLEDRIWTTPDSSRLVKVACGRRHTVALDEHGRVWTVGDNKYGQLGRETNDAQQPEVVSSLEHIKVEQIACGWSHTVILGTTRDEKRVLFGWGRNDKGQLGFRGNPAVDRPRELSLELTSTNEVSLDCGSEFTVVANGDEIWNCGWNEHGNLATSAEDVFDWINPRGAPVTTTPGYEDSRLAIAAGGAHLVAMRVARSNSNTHSA